MDAPSSGLVPLFFISCTAPLQFNDTRSGTAGRPEKFDRVANVPRTSLPKLVFADVQWFIAEMCLRYRVTSFGFLIIELDKGSTGRKTQMSVPNSRLGSVGKRSKKHMTWRHFVVGGFELSSRACFVSVYLFFHRVLEKSFEAFCSKSK